MTSFVMYALECMCMKKKSDEENYCDYSKSEEEKENVEN